MSESLLKVDLHTHILPPAWPDLAKRYGYGGFVRLEQTGCGCGRLLIDQKHFRDVEENLWAIEKRLEECDAHGVALQVLSTVPVMFSYWAKPRDTLDLSRLLNDHIASVVAQHPTRFAGLGTLPMQDPALAVQELERCVKELGLAGVQIGTHIDRADKPHWNLGDPEVVEVFKRASELSACVFVHPWDMMGAGEMPKYWLPWLVGMPAETSRAICSVLFAGVLERFPSLRIAFAHGGGSFPGTIGRIQRGFDCRPDLCAVDTKTPPRAFLGKFWVDSLVHDASSLRSLVSLLGKDKVALGSDYPFPLGEEKPGSLIESMSDLDETTRRKLLRTNALEFLGPARTIPPR